MSVPRFRAVAVLALLPLLSSPAPVGSAEPVVGGPSAVAADPQAVADGPGFRLGAHVDQGAATNAAEAVTGLEDQLGRRLDLVRWYSRWDDAQPSPSVVAAVARGRSPLLSIWPLRRDGTVVSWATIASGAVDDRIRAQAAGIAELDTTVWLTLHHEPDIAQGWGSPAEYRAAWRHYVGVFRAAGVEVRWTWVLTPGSFGSAQTTAGADAFYPGDDVVDRVGLDAYNWYGCAPDKPPNWRSLATVAGPFRQWASARSKIPLLAEFGSAPDPADPTRRPTWLREAVDWLAAWPELEAAALFEGVGTCDWRITGGDAASVAAFSAAVRQAAVRAVPSAWLRPSTTIGAAPLSVAVDGAGSTGSGSVPGSGIASWRLDWGDGSTPETGTGQPGTLRHVYPAGDWTAVLTVTDAAGRTATDSRRVVASALTALSGSETVGGAPGASPSVTLRAWADPHGLPGTLVLRWGPEGGPLLGQVQWTLAATQYAQAFTHTVTGLTPGTRYVWTASASTAAGAATLTRTVATPGPPAIRALAATGVGRTTATIPLRVHPQGLETRVWVEWGAGFAYRSPVQTLAPASWERASTQVLDGLLPGTLYPFRVVASNALGTVTGPAQSLRTLP
ncbi:PKD domain-containing protein [Cellulomonas sp. NPDC089187]|uniref:PKD domain-containing protein n=1 Tax=Cellulomonas sp. NPDC089187 TaxID=3154970 RepID=UPI00343E1DDC